MDRSFGKGRIALDWIELAAGIVYSGRRVWSVAITQPVLFAVRAHIGRASTKRRGNIFNR